MSDHDRELLESVLPCHPSLLRPLWKAWEATSRDLPDRLRAMRVSAMLKKWGFEMSPRSIECTMDFFGRGFFKEDLFSFGPALETDKPGTVVDVVPNDRKCCVCACTDLVVHVHGRPWPGQQLQTTATLWSLTREPRPCRMVDKVCAECGTVHVYSHVSTSPSVVLRVADVKSVPRAVADLRSSLRNQLGVVARYAQARPGAPALTVTRGFDAVCAHWRGSFDLLDGAPEVRAT